MKTLHNDQEQQSHLLLATGSDNHWNIGKWVDVFRCFLLARDYTVPLNNTASCDTVKERLNQLSEAIQAMCEGSDVGSTIVRNTWTSVPLTRIGQTNMQHPGTLSYVIPSVIPSTAKNVLVYAILKCGGANNGPTHDVKIFTQDGSSTRYEKYLFMESWRQSAINTNSDNLWFPMPANRRIYMTISSNNGNNCFARLNAVGYNWN